MLACVEVVVACAMIHRPKMDTGKVSVITMSEDLQMLHMRTIMTHGNSHASMQVRSSEGEQVPACSCRCRGGHPCSRLGVDHCCVCRGYCLVYPVIANISLCGSGM